MIRFLIVRVIFPLLLLLVVRSLLRDLFGKRSKTPQRAERRQPDVTPGGELKKDPVCGTYVSTLAGVRETIKGETVYFCSEACRGKYKS